jgi:hypothetical protein
MHIKPTKFTQKALLAPLFALILLGLPACASGSGGSYLFNRGGDLVDILRLHVMGGKGGAVKLEVTRLLHLGLGWYEAKAWGLHNRELGVWSEKVTDWGLLLGYHNEVEVWDIPRYSGSYGWSFADDGGSFFQEADPGNPLDFLTVRGTLMLFIGIDVEVRVGEVIDFVVGIFQFDPADDDGDYRDVFEE